MNRSFVLLSLGQVVSQLGNRAFTVGVMYWMMEAKQSATLLGVVMALGSAPSVVFGLVGGTFADRFSRLAIVIATDLLRGFAMAVLAFAFIAAPSPLFGALFAVTFLNGVGTAFFSPALTSLLPDIVPARHIESANAIQQFSMRAATLAGQGMAGILYSQVGIAAILLVNGLTFVISGLSALWVRMPEKRVREAAVWSTSDFVRSTGEGLRYVWQHRGMRTFLLAISLFNFGVIPVAVLLPFYVKTYLHVGPNWYGFMLAALSGGTMIGQLLPAALRVDARSRPRIILILLVGIGICFVTLGQVGFVWTALILIFASGILVGVVNIMVLTLLQVAPPDQFRGRVLGLYITICEALTPLGTIVGGIVGDATGRNVPLMYAACGLFAIAIPLVLAMDRSSREFLSSR